jgi:hypothetical protein
MDDPDYAAKYANGAERGDLIGKTQQAMDATHTEGLHGIFLSGGAQVRPESGHSLGGGDIGFESYAASWSTFRVGASAYFGADEGFVGVDLGTRLQTPTRLAPFAGLGTFHGVSRAVYVADRDGKDNDDDTFIDEQGEETSTIDGYLA